LAEPERAAYHRAYYEANKERYKEYRRRWKEKRRAADLRWRYGLSPEDFAILLLHQGGACAICRDVFDGIGKQGTPHLDHEHGGEVRGILCNNCNRSLGGFKDDPDTLRAAIEYLANPPARVVVGKVVQLELGGESA
jgi:hypothetical protein